MIVGTKNENDTRVSLRQLIITHDGTLSLHCYISTVTTHTDNNLLRCTSDEQDNVTVVHDSSSPDYV